ncbi:putative Sentrin-specific protease 8, exported [endosymbiont DhMRE of Dentiscutata heterogama]|uniref:Ulp1 family isopeptidase n=1 Tax=endosymbiont DhMRE of Dentiscutata heterogama TaxID=1609546 RepID=UPI000629DAA6|nr:Ulp1 family isopeptidase [endosymbiont DhMRE of Dentiscutata heterogama]CFW93426.1 putative Sentrin-specific protease 8, exported [endosymbiont DhMRE of Dentiscutata heterogama]
MLGKLFFLLIILFLVWVISWFAASPTKSDKNTKQTSEWEKEKEQTRKEHQAEQNKEWFKEGRWLTDKEIDWACERLPKDKRFKILSAHQFHLVREAKREDDPLIFKELLTEISDDSKELVFILVNNPNHHWSLLVYQAREKRFWHYDTLGGVNYQYVQPLVKELLEQIRQARDIKEEYLANYLIKRHDLRQNNGYDCGVAVIAIMQRIIELKNQSWTERLKYGSWRCGDDLGGGVDLAGERKRLRGEYLAENLN